MEISVFEFVLKAESNLFLPEFKGATFRGKFGHVLKRTICFNKKRDCDQCDFVRKCPYIYLFMSRYQNTEETVKPFVINPPLSSKEFFLKNEKFYLQLILIGKAIDYFPYFVYSFIKMGKEGIGNPSGKYSITAIKNIKNDGGKNEIYLSDKNTLINKIERISLDDISSDMRPQVTLNFLTPTQIKQEGKVVSKINFEVLLKAILRRYHRLRYIHGDGKRIDFNIDWDAVRNIQVIRHDVEEKRFRRYSNKQKRSIPIRGITGKVVLKGNLSPFYHWLKIGEYLHVGKGATFGLGWYRVV
ncbi:CRISPR system precrRNA processing endoribonuclease RAMP protein Cas6 [Calditrichota bacterium GD2]